jgi:hypothetical protein
MVARMLGVADQKILHWIRSGELKATNLARSPHGRPRYAIDLADLEAFEAGRQVIPATGISTPRRLRKRTAVLMKDYFEN